jgi:transcriptional regulator with XRE-family HTH domain
MRLRAGLSQRELAERIGSTQSAIARMEKGETEPKFCTLEKLAEALSRDLLIHVRAVERV